MAAHRKRQKQIKCTNILGNKGQTISTAEELQELL